MLAKFQAARIHGVGVMEETHTPFFRKNFKLTILSANNNS